MTYVITKPCCIGRTTPFLNSRAWNLTAPRARVYRLIRNSGFIIPRISNQHSRELPYERQERRD
jgi:hypothetical protein